MNTRRGPNIFSVQTPQGKFNVVSFTSLPDAARGIPEDSIVGTLPSNVLDIKQETLKPNPSFVRFLHGVVAKHGPLAPSLMNEALQLGTGALLVKDNRVPLIGKHEPEDILGGFQIDEGRIISNSYRFSSDYRIVSKRGLFVLDPWLHERLLEEVAKL
jgi:hypothetical protein